MLHSCVAGVLARFALALAFSVVAAFPMRAAAEDFRAGPLVVVHPWARATPPGANVAGGYLTIENGGDVVDRLLSATVEVAPHVDLHEMKVVEGIMTMRPVKGGIVVPAGGSVAFAPGGTHLMFMDIQHPLKEGEELAGTLVFEKAGTVDVRYVVGPIGSDLSK